MRPEDLAKLTARCVRLAPRVGDGNGPVDHTQIAAVLAGLSREAYLYALVKWIQDKSVEPELFYRIYLMVGELAIKHKWRVPKGREVLRGLTKLAIIEMVVEPRCPKCRGTKCKRCGFTGYLRMSESERARVVGIDKASWFRRWSKCYALVVGEIQLCESTAIEIITRRHV